MPDETKYGSPNPPGEDPGKGAQLACVEFEALLTDALEGQLSEASKQSFDAHRRACAVCGPLFADVESGRLWLRSLEEVEPPQYLVHNILVATTGVVSTRAVPAKPGAAGTTPFAERVREWWDSWFTPVGAFVRQPRFMMSFGMIFFTFSLILSAAGVKASDVARINLRPSALRHTYNDAQIRFVHYYDNIRVVYEIESKVRELKRATNPAEPGPKEKKDNRTPNNDTSGQPEQKQDRNYSKEQGQTVLAKLEVHSDNAHSRSARTDQTFLRQVAAFEAPATSKLCPARGSKLKAQSSLTTNRRFV